MKETLEIKDLDFFGKSDVGILPCGRDLYQSD